MSCNLDLQEAERKLALIHSAAKVWLGDMDEVREVRDWLYETGLRREGEEPKILDMYYLMEAESYITGFQKSMKIIESMSLPSKNDCSGDCGDCNENI